MKNTNRLIIAIAVLHCLFNFSLNAQTTATWLGGKAGRETDWNCAANWKENRKPDELSQVIIPAGRIFYPVLHSSIVSIDAIMIEGTAQLNLEKGANLNVLGETGRLDVIILLGNIVNDGILEIHNKTKTSYSYLEHVKGSGVISTGTNIVASR